MTQPGFAEGRRILVVGPVGSGKSTLIRAHLDAHPDVLCLNADPGNPSFGPPAALSLGRRHGGQWELLDVEPVGTLNAQRFRMPVVVAARRLLSRTSPSAIVVDSPGVSRGVGASELVAALAELFEIDLVVAVGKAGDALGLVPPGISIQKIESAAAARPATDATRRGRRSKAFADYMAAGAAISLASAEVVDVQGGSTQGRVAVVETACGAASLGYVEHDRVVWRAVGERPVRVVLRDALWSNEVLQTVAAEPKPRVAAEPTQFTFTRKPWVTFSLPMERVASARLLPIGTWFDDPMWLMRLDHRKRCLAFDLGEVGQVPTRVVHEISDVFVSHAHLDHVRDFMWFVRKRLGTPDPCRLIGPAGFARRVDHMLRACTWDRVEDRGPRFDVAELHGSTLRWSSLQVGVEARFDDRVEIVHDRIVADDDRFVVRAIELDHHLPVLAFGVEERARFDVRPDILRNRGWKPGDWLGELKTLASRDRLDAVVEVPGVGTMSVAELTAALLIRRRPEKFVYATDLADHADNRDRLVEFARGADVFVCEASFREHDRDQAERTGHLTARACGEIAQAAKVRWLIPFHPSSRYHDDWSELLAEVRAACDCVVSGFQARLASEL